MMLDMERSQVNFRIDTGELERWQAAAEAAGMKLSAWIRERCNETDERKSPPVIPAYRDYAGTAAKVVEEPKAPKKKACDAPVGPGVHCPKCGRRH